MFRFTPGLVRETNRPIALACPGIVRDGEVLYATNLGWPDRADPKEELGLQNICIVENDAVAAGLGESVLRSKIGPEQDLFYVSLGTGVGSVQVANGTARYFDLGHHYVGGTAYCAGCRSVGCLNAYLCSSSLPTPLGEQDQIFVARMLAGAFQSLSLTDQVPLVLGGGIVRRYPGIGCLVNEQIANRVELTAAPLQAKSAAYAGLEYLSQIHRLN
ncbi:ROK family protein [Reticulibacter mediterranei]|uniref:ROK family protein n=1 Tax=Reticulibacter mediterranei TaxID=2778369 RepID=UPI001C689175|nr:ROK family protein [Reticulibacter mediterranei]